MIMMQFFLIILGVIDHVNLTQVYTMEEQLSFTNPEAMFKFDIHGIDLSGTNLDFIRKFQHEINGIAKYF